MRHFKVVDAWIGRVYHVVGSLVGISIAVFAVVIPVDLVLRLFKIGNLPGMQEIVEYALFTGVFLAAPWVLRLGAHVRVDVAVSALPQPVATAVERLLDAVGLAICATLTWFGWQNLSQAYRYGSEQMKYFNVPEWWLLSVFVTCFALLSLEFLFRVLRAGDAHEAHGDAHEGGV